MATPGGQGAAANISAEGSKLFRIRKTMMKMLVRRGYVVGENNLNETLEQFVGQFTDNPTRENMTLLVEKADDQTDQIFVFFPEDEKVGVKPIRTYSDRMQEMSVNRAIIVVKGGITPFARSAVQELMGQRNVIVEDFKDSELMLDITEHVLVPEHEVLGPARKAELLKRYKLKETQLPRIQSTDPVARYYGMKKGQVVKITRPSETAGRYVTYRLCI